MSRCSWKYKLLLTSLFALAYAVFYVLPNLRPPFPPLQLPLLWVDRVVPFLPWTVVIYLSDWLLALWVIILVKDVDSFNKLSRMAFMTLTICGIFFLFAPTTYPRPIYPTDEFLPIQLLLNLLEFADKPTNCFPSNHVAMASIFVWAVRGFDRRKYLGFLIWAVAIFISTLTTKQHYFLDILGGLVVAAAVVTLEYALFAKRWARTFLSRPRQ
jgi:membrane-associated phospholipid phosphatase